MAWDFKKMKFGEKKTYTLVVSKTGIKQCRNNLVLDVQIWGKITQLHGLQDVAVSLHVKSSKGPRPFKVADALHYRAVFIMF